MPAGYHVHPDLNLIHFTYWGEIAMDDPLATVAQSQKDPASRPGMHHLVDVARATGFRPSSADLLTIQARLLDSFPLLHTPTLVVWYAPNGPGRKIAQFVARSWACSPAVRILTVEDTMAVADVLRLDHDRIARLLMDPIPQIQP